MVDRVIATPRARALIERLRLEHGPLLLRQDGACLDGAQARLVAPGDFEHRASGLLLGEVAGCPAYVGRGQAGYWRFAQLIVDLDEDDSSRPAPGVTSLRLRSRRFSTEEWAALAGVPLD